MPAIPEVLVGIVAVSRDCFPIELSRSRRDRVGAACAEHGVPVAVCDTIIENENDVAAAIEELDRRGVNALVIYLGNFGPEGPLSLLAELFWGPVMLVGAAEERTETLIEGRGDAFCGMLNASYSMGLRQLAPHIPASPVGQPADIALRIAEFIPVARIVIGVTALKIITFGPRPQDFFACNAPIKPLFDMGIEIMENSELDLLDLFKSVGDDDRVNDIAREMAEELGAGNTYPDLLVKLARYERALERFIDENRGLSTHAIVAAKCWPAFEKNFGFVPCYVNSRLASRGVPVACEVDIYGALSEFMTLSATGLPPTILDINNTVPVDMIEKSLDVVGEYDPSDLFMGFHCGNTPSSCMAGSAMRHQLIMHRLMEPDGEPDITRGTLEGRLRPGPVTIFRLQGTAGCSLASYVAEGDILDIDPQSFGGIGVFAVQGMERFYRHVLIGRHFPHHTAVAFAHAGKALYAAVRMLDVTDISWNQPPFIPYPGENPFI